MREDFLIQWLDSDTVFLIERIDAAGGALAAEEQPFGQDMQPRRLREFTAGRSLARRALSAMGETPAAIRVGAIGEPLWPSGVVGSISHTLTHAAVVMSRPARHASVGIDLDDHRLLGEAAAKDLMADEEIELMHQAGWARERSQAQNLVFCAKEALFKCQYPLTGLGELDFEHVQLCPSDRPGVLRPDWVLGVPGGVSVSLEAINLYLHVFKEIRLVVALAAEGV